LTGEANLPWVVSSILCFMMDACDRTRDWDRAREWIKHVEAVGERWGDRVVHAQCRPHYAVVLTWRGDWDDAERELKLAIDDLTAFRKPMAVEGIVRLAELRWRQGRWAEAESLFEEVKNEPLAQMGRAALAIDTGRPTLAVELAEAAMRRLPPTNRVERAQALEVYVKACMAGGELDCARTALPELLLVAEEVPTLPIRAAVEVARGLMAEAERDLVTARTHLEDAVSLYDRCAAPFEAAGARLELARVLAGLGRPDDSIALAEAARSAFDSLGAAAGAERARRMLAGPEQRRVAVSGLSTREVEVLKLLASGLSNQQIADRLVLSVRTVQRHVENIYGKTGARGRAAAAVFATNNGL
jgi:DNA-binding NarL/FixJ family response regulator